MGSFQRTSDRSSPSATAVERGEKVLLLSCMGWPLRVSLPSARLPLIPVGVKHQEQENTEMSMLR